MPEKCVPFCTWYLLYHSSFVRTLSFCTSSLLKEIANKVYHMKVAAVSRLCHERHMECEWVKLGFMSCFSNLFMGLTIACFVYFLICTYVHFLFCTSTYTSFFVRALFKKDIVLIKCTRSYWQQYRLCVAIRDRQMECEWVELGFISCFYNLCYWLSVPIRLFLFKLDYD